MCNKVIVIGIVCLNKKPYEIVNRRELAIPSK